VQHGADTVRTLADGGPTAGRQRAGSGQTAGQSAGRQPGSQPASQRGGGGADKTCGSWSGNGPAAVRGGVWTRL